MRELTLQELEIASGGRISLADATLTGMLSRAAAGAGAAFGEGIAMGLGAGAWLGPLGAVVGAGIGAGIAFYVLKDH